MENPCGIKIMGMSNVNSMRGSRKFFERGSKSTLTPFFFKLMGGGGGGGERGTKYHYKRAIIGSPAKRHLNDVSLAFHCWTNIKCWLGSFVNFSGNPGQYC